MRLQPVEEGVLIALEALRTNKLRSGLTVLGVAIGVAVVVTMAALITGIRSSVLEGFEAAGPDNFIVTRFDMTEVRLVSDGSGRPPWWNMPKITDTEAKRISRLSSVREAVVDFDFSATYSYEGRRIEGVQTSGDSEGWPSYVLGEFVAGRNFITGEVLQSRAVVVLSRPLAQELFGRLDPVGRRIRISSSRRSNVMFTVGGVFETEPNIFSEAVRHWAVMPYTAAQKRLKVWDGFLSVLVVPDEAVAPRTAMDQVIGAMRSMRGLTPKEGNNFAILRSTEIVELFDQLTGVFFLVMLALSSVGLMVGGVGVIGIMMISVTERTREIGVRKAVGATRGEILWQFLVEAAVLTLVGGALGMLIGAGGAELVAHYTPIPARIPLWSVVAALAMAILTGMLFGLIPAIRGSRLEPVDALRYE